MAAVAVVVKIVRFPRKRAIPSDTCHRSEGGGCCHRMFSGHQFGNIVFLCGTVHFVMCFVNLKVLHCTHWHWYDEVSTRNTKFYSFSGQNNATSKEKCFVFCEVCIVQLYTMCMAGAVPLQVCTLLYDVTALYGLPGNGTSNCMV